MPDPNESEAEYRARVKEASRGSRLSFQNRAEHLLRRDLKEEAMESCKGFIKSFAECSKANGLMVIINCRDQLKEMNGCLEAHNGEAAWQKYKEAHKEELEVRSKGLKLELPSGR